MPGSMGYVIMHTCIIPSLLDTCYTQCCILLIYNDLTVSFSVVINIILGLRKELNSCYKLVQHAIFY